jgi:tryptophan synthase alpha chain
MDRIASIFQAGSKALVIYITAGYPSVKETVLIMHTLVENGADIIELGYPYSDPTADGSVIQASSQSALDFGFRPCDYFAILQEFRADNPVTPVVVFGYYNPIYHYGVDPFARKIKECGADALLVVDLPYEEQNEIRPVLDKYQLHLIQLIAPTTSDERARSILETATGFVYQILVKGVTGERNNLESNAVEQTQRIKLLTALPVVLGFGISTAQQAREVAQAADGVVVGSAIVREISNNLPDFQDRLAKRINELAGAVHCTV